jgi:hypothetical protein
LVQISLPQALEAINDGAFSSSGLQNISIPGKVHTLGNLSFSSCKNLTAVSFATNSELKEIGTGCFKGCTPLSGIQLPDSVLRIGSEAFASTSLEAVVFPSKVTSIGALSFANCEKLRTAAFSNNSQVTKIPFGLFENCSGLTNVTLPALLNTIEDRAFLSSALIRGDLPGPVTNVSGRAFGGSVRLESISIGSNVSVFSKEVFADCRVLLKVYLRGKTIPNVFCPALDYVPTKDNLTIEVDADCENNTICGRTVIRPTPTPSKHKFSPLMIGAIAVGSTLVILILVVGIVICVRKKRKNEKENVGVRHELLAQILDKQVSLATCE